MMRPSLSIPEPDVMPSMIPLRVAGAGATAPSQRPRTNEFGREDDRGDGPLDAFEGPDLVDRLVHLLDRDGLDQCDQVVHAADRVEGGDLGDAPQSRLGPGCRFRGDCDQNLGADKRPGERPGQKHRISLDHAVALEPFEPALYRGPGELEAPRQLGRGQPGILAEQAQQCLVRSVDGHIAHDVRRSAEYDSAVRRLDYYKPTKAACKVLLWIGTSGG